MTVKEGQGVSAPATPTRPGYAFKGWDQSLPSSVTSNLTISAQWEAITYTITFDADGGAFSDKTTSKTMKAVWNGSNYRISGAPADPVREGYVFDGWSISNVGSYNFTSNTTVKAKWVLGNVYTITFKINAPSMTDPSPIRVAKTNDSKLPALPTVSTRTGYTFLGWYSGTLSGADLKNPVKWSQGDKLTADLTLYALWQAVGEDTYSFSNSSRYFDSYKITDQYFDYLTSGEHPTWKYNMRKEFYEFYDPQSRDDWDGSCFGMSAVYCLARGSAITLSTFQSGASTLQALKSPRQSASIQDLINYYMMAQSTAAGVQGKLEYWGRGQTDRYSRIVSDLTAERGFSLLGFNSSSGGHTLVARSIQRGSDGQYRVEIWDPNYPDELGELVIASNYSSARFSSDTSGASSYNVGTELKYIMPFSTRSRTYDVRSLQTVFGRNTTPSSRTTDAGCVLISSSTGDFTLSTADGRRAVVKNGSQTSGTLTLLDGTLDGGPGNGYRFYIQENNLGEVTISLNGGNSEVSFVSDRILANVSADGLNSVVIGDGKITTSCSSASQQEITMVSENLGSTWDVVTVTGKDTGLTLDADRGTLKVSSRSNSSVAVQGENTDSRKTSPKRTVTAAAAGAAITMSDLSLTVQQPANPFVDVAASAYYYDAVLWAAANGVTGGTTATTFSPDDPCTRAQIVTFLWRAAGSPKPALGFNPFVDVAAGTYYYDAVLWAVEQGITGGTTATTFSPNDACTRGQTVSFLWRAAGSPKAAGYINPFADVATGAYYASAVQWAVEQRITSGLSVTSFGPEATVTRGQTVTFLYRSQGT